jgi:hypothetical protein
VKLELKPLTDVVYGKDRQGRIMAISPPMWLDYQYTIGAVKASLDQAVYGPEEE